VGSFLVRLKSFALGWNGSSAEMEMRDDVYPGLKKMRMGMGVARFLELCGGRFFWGREVPGSLLFFFFFWYCTEG